MIPRVSLLAAMLLFLFACSGPEGPDPGPTDPGGGDGGPIENPTDDPTAADLLAGIEQHLPTWDQIDAVAADLTRLPLDDFSIQIRDISAPTVDVGPPPPPSGGFTYFQETWQYHADLQAGWPESDFWGGKLTIGPPYTQHDGSFFYPFDQTLLDEKLRSMATIGAYQKTRGLALHVTWFHPPWLFDPENLWQMHAQDVDSIASFLDWWSNYHVALWIQIARMAERIGAEQLVPWDIEVGMTARYAQELAGVSLSPTEELALARELQDRLLSALRPVFSGALSAPVYDRYDQVGDHWKQLDVSGWDNIGFVFFTEGDVATTELYFQLQLDGYMQVAERANLPWIAHLDIAGDRHRQLLPPDVTWEDIEEQVWGASFDAVLGATPAPSGLEICPPAIEVEATRQMVHQRLAGLARR